LHVNHHYLFLHHNPLNAMCVAAAASVNSKRVGEVVWHSLDEDGSIGLYDVLWEGDEMPEEGLMVDELIGVSEQTHKHETRGR